MHFSELFQGNQGCYDDDRTRHNMKQLLNFVNAQKNGRRKAKYCLLSSKNQSKANCQNDLVECH